MLGVGDATNQDVHLPEGEDPLQAAEHQMLYAQGLGGERASKIGLSRSTARMQDPDAKARTCVLWMVRPTARNDY